MVIKPIKLAEKYSAGRGDLPNLIQAKSSVPNAVVPR